jgi:hypothetical protein
LVLVVVGQTPRLEGAVGEVSCLLPPHIFRLLLTLSLLVLVGQVGTVLTRPSLGLTVTLHGLVISFPLVVEVERPTLSSLVRHLPIPMLVETVHPVGALAVSALAQPLLEG